LANDGPVDAGLRARFFASAEAALAVLVELATPAEGQVSAGGAEPGCGERSRHMRELEALLEAGNSRALDHLPWLERCLAAEAPAEGRELLRQIEAHWTFRRPWKPCAEWERTLSPTPGERREPGWTFPTDEIPVVLGLRNLRSN